VAIGQAVERIVTIRNDNPAGRLNIDRALTSIVGTNAGDFYWKPTDNFTMWQSRGGVPYDYTVDIIVGFRPRARGSRAGALKIVDNQLYSPHMVSLSGTGQ